MTHRPAPFLQRRALLALGAATVAGRLAAVPAVTPAAQPPVPAPRSLQFPRDHGAHPDWRTEWWYLTGRLLSGARVFGFQLTFFRTRVDGTTTLQAPMRATQLVLAHAALTDVQGGQLWHDQALARSSTRPQLDSTETDLQDTGLRLRHWRLQRGTQGYTARLQTGSFGLDLACATTQPLLLQGDNGLSRKGPETQQASYYYSQPQLATRGSLWLHGKRFEVAGRAWLDHEWSEALLHPLAVGWDWTGINLLDGAALTAFRLRTADGQTLWSGGSFRTASGQRQAFAAGSVRFMPLRHWQSPHSQARYPVEWQVHTPAGSWRLRAVLDDQELDGRASTGAVYWEGLSGLFDPGGQLAGHGYLEMTGYVQPLKL